MLTFTDIHRWWAMGEILCEHINDDCTSGGRYAFLDLNVEATLI